MDRLFRLVTRRARWVLAAGLILTGVAIHGLVDLRAGELRLQIDPSLDRLLPDDPARDFYERLRLLLGNDDIVTVVLADGDVFTRNNLARVERLTRRLEGLEGVHHVVSLFTALDIRSRDGDLVIEPFLRAVPRSDRELRRLRAAALGNPVYTGNLVSPKGNATALIVHLLDLSERELRKLGVTDEIRRAAEEEAGEASVWITGGPHVKAETSRLLLQDVARATPAAVAVIALIALLSYRSIRGVLVPLTTVGIALLWTLAAMAWAGAPLNLVTVILPPLILTVGFAYTIHIVSDYYEALGRAAGAASGGRGGQPVREALRHVGFPVLLTAVTTAAGFGALLLSPLDAIREFGIFCMVGVAATAVASLTLAPALLALLPAASSRRGPGGRWIDRIAWRTAEFDLQHRWLILAGGALLVAVSVVGIFRIRVSADLITNFPAQHSVRRDFEAINAVLEGSNPFYVVVEASEQRAFQEPEHLRTLQELQAWLQAQEGVGGTTSLADYVVLLNRGFHDGDPSKAVIPDSKALVSQLLFFGAGGDIETFVDTSYRTAGILVRSTVIESQQMAVLVGRIRARLESLPEGLTGTVTGNPVLLTRTLDGLSRGQVLSLTAAFGVILAILCVLLGSLQAGLLALIPNALPVVAYFGMLGLSGVTLNPTTSLVACIVLGIAVDDTIHLLSRYRQLAREGRDERARVGEALRTVARPVTFTTISLCAGFLVLTTSQLRNQVEFGVLASLTLAVAWVVDVTLTPVLCRYLERRPRAPTTEAPALPGLERAA